MCKSLAQQYPGLNFYVIPITGINDKKITHIKNSAVQSFNERLKSKVNSGRVGNLKFKSILNGNDPNTILVDGKPISIVNYMTADGLHYKTDGYKYLWKAMANKL